MATIHQLIREIQAEHGRGRTPAEPVRVAAGLIAAGLDSCAIGNVQLKIELPDEMRQSRWYLDTVPIASLLSSLTCPAEPTCI